MRIIAAMMTMVITATAIPALPPVLRPLWAAGAGVGVGVGVDTELG